MTYYLSDESVLPARHNLDAVGRGVRLEGADGAPLRDVAEGEAAVVADRVGLHDPRHEPSKHVAFTHAGRQQRIRRYDLDSCGNTVR